MKKILISLMMAVMAITAVGQDVGEQMFIYHGGTVTGGFLPNAIDSITYSYYDADSVRYDDVVTQEIYTPDSIYRIPLAEIDSVSFYTPSTIYQPDAFVLSDELKNYIVSANILTLSFLPDVPSNILPKVGDKIVSVECNENLPFCFLGMVKSIENKDSVIILQCDTINVEDVLQRFYRAFHSKPMSEDYYSKKNKKNVKNALDESLVIHKSFEFNLLDFTVQPIEGDPFNWGAGTSSSADFEYDCLFDGFMVFDFPITFKFNITGNYNKKVSFSSKIYGHIGASGEIPFTKLPPFPIPGTFLFVIFEAGWFGSIDGNLYWQYNEIERYKGKLLWRVDVTPPIGIIPPIIKRHEKLFEEEKVSEEKESEIMCDLTAETGVYAMLGVSPATKEIGHLSLRAEVGLRTKSEFPILNPNPIVQGIFDLVKLLDANKNTDYYEQISSYVLSVDFFARAKIVWGILALSGTIISGEVANNFFSLHNVPTFYNVKATRKTGNKTQVVCSSELENDCVIGQKLGFALFDSNDNFIKFQYYEDKEYRTRSDFSTYTVTIDGLEKGKKYKVYPVIKLFNKDILATPCVEVEEDLEVTTIRASEIKKTSAVLEGKISGNDSENANGEVGFYYSTNNNFDHPNYVSCGNVMNLPDDGIFTYKITELEPNTKYYFGAVYKGDTIVEGNAKSFKTMGGENLCPDGDHPHLIDLGLPSGTLWSCQNIGADAPDDNGGYYAWGETTKKYVFNAYTYDYYDKQKYEYVDIGMNISGTSYDVATSIWKAPWRMPISKEIEELCKNCDKKLYTLNGAKGILFEGKNGNVIFFPFAGDMHDGGLYGENEYGYYWSDTQVENLDFGAYNLFITDKGTATCNYGQRHLGRTVRPVCNKKTENPQ